MHFVIDQNFPWHVLPFEWPPTIRISSLWRLDRTLTIDREGGEVILSLHRRGDVDGFVTNDSKLLWQATEMIALSRTQLILVITDGVGHDPIRATGLVMVHLQEIARRDLSRPHICLLRPKPLGPPEHVRVQIDKIAARDRIAPYELIAREKPRVDGFFLR